MNALKDNNELNIDYTQIGGGAGVVGGIIWGMYKHFGFGKTALYALIFGAAGAYIGYQIKNNFGDEKES